ncbi:hypothetical protein QR680_010699 [Steinernema hermaphroditum]|uniref:HAP1 N-terminal domain-containing protein n=1 Tax=Steinernema hermaphroditum TaxID=289476 RepID=A0AA39IPV0_9BILA|nr:hypothetical protein QR680_010699 [Steinernema hermaphroditum]
MFLFILTLIGCNSTLCNPPKELSARRRRHMHKVPTASLPYDDASAIAQLLEEKEKDLELAAQIGKSLLEQNRELQERNDFLEESLIKSNEKTNQLQHQLKQRINLLHSISDDYDDDADLTNAARERRANVDSLRRKIRQLEGDNDLLKTNLSELRAQNSTLEEKERELAEEYIRQLELAHDKIARLKTEIAAKNEECAVQNAEVEQLIKDINTRHSREKMLNQENMDLHVQLTEALEKQDQLTATVEGLQERYTEVMGMLQDAEEELSNFRQRGNLYLRTTSSDSLYDSLASELEASDSGFYNTPMISARSESRQSHPSNLHSEMEKLSGGHLNGALSLGAELSAQLSDPQFLPFSETAATPLKEGEILEVPSTVMIEIAVNRSRSRSRPKALKEESEPEEIPEPVKPELKEILPILIEVPTPMTPLATSTPVAAQRGVSRIVDDETASTSSTLSKSTSSESLNNYEGPKMGQPGQPGTRDLDFGIRRLQLRKQIEMDYQKYRRERGLAPSKSQSSAKASKAKLSKMVAQLAKSRNLLPQWSFAQEAQEKLIANDPFAKFLASTDPLRVSQPFRKLTHIGLFGALTNGESAGTSNGILTRRNVSERLSAPSTPTSSPSHMPSTPLRHLVYTNGQSLKASPIEADPINGYPPEDPSPLQQRPSRLMGAVSGIFTRSASVRLPKNTLALSRDNSPTSLTPAKYDIVARGSIL